jgi:AcrR family transcriptional regulator
MATTRITRLERKAQTRAELIAAARLVFVRRGFHGASLDEIAEEAGYTKGAVYSNFADKDALFLAVLGAHYDRRVETYEGMILGDGSLDETFLAVSRFMAQADATEPDWLPLLAEFVAHAARDEDLRRAYVDTRERFLEAVAGMLEELSKRHGVTLRVSYIDAARASSVLARGLSAERRLEPDVVATELFVELHTALMRGLTVPSERSDP